MSVCVFRWRRGQAVGKETCVAAEEEEEGRDSSQIRASHGEKGWAPGLGAQRPPPAAERGASEAVTPTPAKEFQPGAASRARAVAKGQSGLRV